MTPRSEVDERVGPRPAVIDAARLVVAVGVHDQAAFDEVIETLISGDGAILDVVVETARLAARSLSAAFGVAAPDVLRQLVEQEARRGTLP